HVWTVLFNAVCFTGAGQTGPGAGLLLSSNVLYGSTVGGGEYGFGFLFSINTDGTGFTILHNMTNAADGLEPSTMVPDGSNLFGTTRQGGTNFLGTVFSAQMGTTNYSTLFTFQGLGGEIPFAGLALGYNTLYGTTQNGGTNNEGALFSISTNGTGYTTLFNFGANYSGITPIASLLLVDNTLYGTASHGGTNNDGTIFSISTNGAGFMVLHDFGGTDGEFPVTDLKSSGGNLYGTARGGTNGEGVVFSINTNCSGYTILHTFSGPEGSAPTGLTLCGDTLFGTTSSGGAFGSGTVFMMNTNGSNLMVLHNFNPSTEGDQPQGDLIFSGSTLYGALGSRGLKSQGSLFKLAIAPVITNIDLGLNTLTINGAFGLESHEYIVLTSTNVALPITQWTPVWTNVLTRSGNFTFAVTNVATTALQGQFYALQVQ
ncbi:MAG TPA: choice-of-anchor tandem repeat GloVer-containing protein, partial [Candidatus Acidoferrum sp.]|nr:choice-of-anchor tandem repeat GloVer-containing protein [Candidatus Acidoferrum sp.]